MGEPRKCRRPNCDRLVQHGAHHGYCRRHARVMSIGDNYVPSGPTLAHLHHLLDGGWSCAAIARASGVSVDTIYDMRDNPRPTVRESTARGILATHLTDTASTGDEWVHAWPVQRRARSLQAAGWSQAEIARLTGITPTTISKVTVGCRYVTRRTADVINKAWQDLAPEPVAGPPTATAKKHGWPVPMWWDDIDDPDEQPGITHCTVCHGPDPRPKAGTCHGCGERLASRRKRQKAKEARAA